mmetsp:Transcript_11129/g.25330  ORF Transcript_11129/g.25330 Transcript_11129/m.25330 type:complete len:212 (+) Transcript_11129:1397-2032(+)
MLFTHARLSVAFCMLTLLLSLSNSSGRSSKYVFFVSLMLATSGNVSSIVSLKYSTQATSSRSWVMVSSGRFCPSGPPICCTMWFEQTWATHELQSASMCQWGAKHGFIWFFTMSISVTSSVAARRIAVNCWFAASSSSASSAADSCTPRNMSTPLISKSWYSCSSAAALMFVNLSFPPPPASVALGLTAFIICAATFCIFLFRSKLSAARS